MQNGKQYALTAQQAKAKAFIACFMEENGGMAPTHREIAAGIGLRSPSGAHRIMVTLQERGHIEVLAGRARAMRILGDAQ